MLYNYKKQLINMPATRVGQCLEDLERVLRSSEFQYHAPRLTKVQVDGMAASWPKEIFTQFTAKAKTLAGESKVTPEQAYQAAIDVLLNYVPAAKAAEAAKQINTTYTKRAAITDIAVSMLLNVAFDLEPTGMKKFGDQKVSVRKILSTNKAVVDCKEVNDADIFIFVFVNDELPVARIIGWMKQKDVRSMNRGNKITDETNCRWTDMSFWCDISKLNPIGTFLRESGIDKVPNGILFERIPQFEELPIPEINLTKKIMEPRKDTSSEFYEMLGLDDPTPGIKHDTPADVDTGSGMDF